MSSSLHKTIYQTWISSGLDAIFKAYWDVAVVDEFLSLNDQEAQAKNPFPYCVYEIGEGSTRTRMSGPGVDTKFEHRDFPVAFRIHAAPSGELSAKEVAATLEEEVRKVFGGHHEIRPQELTLEVGSIVLLQYQSDVGIREEDENYQWIVRYQALLDAPIKV